ncbi:hypothetical protein [Halorhodospira sp. 9622]|uniref:hypothetical protein n=1 Tax=Halorhodospira sp. 9622 TaxID=2899136 RepID=UPI001EE8C2AA|nr:hypothetical protein [Halorhodospira sp. 9622]MCG5537847.1 hypothetical protein [Halorhodospira sp. 9622]
MEWLVGPIAIAIVIFLAHAHGGNVSKKIGANPKTHSIKEGLDLAKKRQEMPRYKKAGGNFVNDEEEVALRLVPQYADAIHDHVRPIYEDAKKRYGSAGEYLGGGFYNFTVGVFAAFSSVATQSAGFREFGTFNSFCLLRVGAKLAGEQNAESFLLTVNKSMGCDDKPPGFESGIRFGTLAANQFFIEEDPYRSRETLKSAFEAQFSYLL